MSIVLHDYWRSSASYRVRIALHALGLSFEARSVDLVAGAHRAPEHLARHPQGLVPALEIDGMVLTQSLSIIEYLDETRGAGFLPKDPAARAKVRAIAHAIAMEIHPVCNLSVARFATGLSDGKLDMKGWMQAFIPKGLAAVEAMLPETGGFCHGERLSMADLCLVPQVYNARRWEVDLSPLPRVARISTALDALPAVASAHPDNYQPET